ncbi:hypothetical protein BCR35DRAFT_350291 [Leucosporidium creatinivorum]|uniref:Uncharacterized protein n=1 Tax=Leucosporidium creatinivorum TaxID=106004 RepID=A0A1Y2G190_9BASI|nr:hypothetical protein BCR35DRAFT_350291 [Leucosporidium creatinivorum]
MPTRMLLPLLSLIPPAVLYQQHLRLLAAYPTLVVPSHLDISRRRDKPEVGMDRLSGEDWRGCHAGDAWSAVVPRRLLAGHGLREGSSPTTASGKDDLALAWARAFWGTWPLALERNIMKLLVSTGVGPFELRKGKEGTTEVDARNFAQGAKVLDGLFIVEAHDEPSGPSKEELASPSTNDGSSLSTQEPTIEGPIIASWWLSPVPTSPSASGRLLGGYHSFSVTSLPPPFSSASEAEDLVRLDFSCHILVDSPLDKRSHPSSTGTAEFSASLSLVQKLAMQFHLLYSRILMDCAIKRLKSSTWQ